MLAGSKASRRQCLKLCYSHCLAKELRYEPSIPIHRIEPPSLLNPLAKRTGPSRCGYRRRAPCTACTDLLSGHPNFGRLWRRATYRLFLRRFFPQPIRRGWAHVVHCLGTFSPVEPNSADFLALAPKITRQPTRPQRRPCATNSASRAARAFRRAVTSTHRFAKSGACVKA